MACLGQGMTTQLREASCFLSPKLQDRVPGRVGPGSVRVTFQRCKQFTGLSTKAVAECVPVVQSKERRESGIGGSGERLDQWMKESVGEIVKNLQEAPLFVHVYGGGQDTRLKTEMAVAEDWAHIKGKWVNGQEPAPEGIILVEELKEEVEVEDDLVEGQNGECTKAWGVLVQGKGDDGGVACYLLKTSKVGCGGNVGIFCTHYCLVKVKSFRETFKSQLTNCWLA